MKKMNAFIYEADFGRKNPIKVLEIYYDRNPHSTEWRQQRTEFALRLDEDLVDGLDEGVAIPELVLSFAMTALEEVMLNH